MSTKGTSSERPVDAEPLDLEARELQTRLRAGAPPPLLLDCREPWEYARVHFPGARLVPLGELGQRLAEIPHDAEVVVYCHHGVRSRHAAARLRAAGRRARSLAGGIDGWARHIDTTLPRY